jgi:hypothetical protein
MICPAASRPFDMTKYRQRYVALEVMYLGWRYSGLARQETTDMTIEVGPDREQQTPFMLVVVTTAVVSCYSSGGLRRGSFQVSRMHTAAHISACIVALQAQLFSALRQTRLIPEDAQPAALRYSRCGRTDKGVSACGQVGGWVVQCRQRP